MLGPQNTFRGPVLWMPSLSWCAGCPVDGRPFKEVEVGDCVLEAVDRFCYLGDMLSAGGGCMAAATARCRCAWGKFRENLPLLTSKPVPFDLRGRLFSSNVRSSMLHGTETWPMTSAALHRLCRNDRAMIRWICGVKPSDDPSMDELHAKLGICDLAILVRERRLRWFGHVMRSNGEINRVRSRSVPGRKGPGRPKKTWEECVKQDLKVCGLSEAGTQDRLSWRSSVKNSRQEPTPSNGSLPQSMAAPPARRVLGMRTRSFNKTGFDWLTYATDWWAVIGPVIHSESKSQANRSSSDHEGLLHTLSTIDTQESKFRVHLVLEILAKLMVGENLSWEFPKVGVWLILEVRLILETRRYIFTSFLLLYSKCNNTRTYVWVTYIAFEWKLFKRRPDG